MRRSRDRGMDTSSQCNRAWLLRRSLTNVSGFGARGLHRADRRWESCRLVRLLRQTHLPARRPGFIFHGMGRTLNGAVRLGQWQRILSSPTLPADILLTTNGLFDLTRVGTWRSVLPVTIQATFPRG